MIGELAEAETRPTLGEKLLRINLGVVALLAAVSCIGFAMLYSAANGHVEPWAARQMARFAVGLVVMIAVAVIDIRVWLRTAYPLYLLGIMLLVAVQVAGQVGMGAQRWIDLGVLQLQPSEVMKVTLVLALARYFHGASTEDVAPRRRMSRGLSSSSRRS